MKNAKQQFTFENENGKKEIQIFQNANGQWIEKFYSRGICIARLSHSEATAIETAKHLIARGFYLTESFVTNEKLAAILTEAE